MKVTCQACHGNDLVDILDLGLQPVAERYEQSNVLIRSSIAYRKYPLLLQKCLDCSLIQLSKESQLDQHVVFPLNHPYATGNSSSLRKHFTELAKEVSEGLHDGDLVVDIGANDTTLLSALDPAINRVAVEPTNQGLKGLNKDITVYQEFFTAETAYAIHGQFPQLAKVITATNVLAHVPDPHDFLIGVRGLLAEDGIFITENHHVRNILDGMQFDTVYHEHLRYFSVESLSYLLGRHGLTIQEVRDIPTHGGSFRVYAKRANTSNIQNNASKVAEKLKILVTAIKRDGGMIFGVGATTRAAPLIHFSGIAPHISCVCEVRKSEKVGFMMPGTHIPIVDEQRLIEEQPSHALIFSWHMADTIVPKLREQGFRGDFIVPLPTPRILED